MSKTFDKTIEHDNWRIRCSDVNGLSLTIDIETEDKSIFTGINLYGFPDDVTYADMVYGNATDEDIDPLAKRQAKNEDWSSRQEQASTQAITNEKIVELEEEDIDA